MSHERVPAWESSSSWSEGRLREILRQEPYTDDTLKRERWLSDRNGIHAYRCGGSVRNPARPWQELDDGVIIGKCPVCEQTVLCYKDLGYYLCVEHLRPPKANPCGECQGPIWDDDYLCVWCRAIP
jgi:hypothetical protein